ncbi:3-hydroxybutyryl-CoA dehydrogenase [Elioraea tepida]|uniref:3-hydroxybutyryl-CoA dehydrogenase n=2 Tax=Elioraea tepida TaxID=2843330 RepID=A0A975U4J1_9PROT|nr:3-hydroxybutyryl-CoA dehydrogenase [Elioraea tepida]
MGSGIAHVAALAGLEVAMVDVNPAALDKAVASIARNIDRQVAKGAVTAEAKERALARITTGTDHSVFADADMVIEAATENAEVKKGIFRALCPVLKPTAIIATNTSSISITGLAAATDRPARFIGMHFMNPVPVMRLVEVIRGIATDDATFEATVALAQRLGKTTATAADYPGFIVNRILVPMINEAVQALQEGVGDVVSIDTAMKLGTNQPMGPLELADFIGLDTCLAIMRVLHEGFADSKYRPAALLVKYVEAGWLGRKTGRGFYDYSTTSPSPTR